MTAVIRTSGLTKHFGSVRALVDLDLEVRPGEIFGYLGPNGAGKTTTIRLLLDAIRPTGGDLSVFGSDATDVSVRRRIGYVPAELRFDPTYTAADLFDFCAALRGGSDRTLLGELTKRFDLDTSRRIGELSTGNRRKVGIVQAFVHRPELLLLDEPSTGLDPLLQQEFQQLVREAVADGATVFLSSHVLPEVEALADRVAILRAGRLVRVAAVEELLDEARQRIDLHVAGRVDPAVFARLRSVESATVQDKVVQLVIRGSVDRVIKEAANVTVRRIVTHEADLEEIFFDLYSGDPS